MLTSQEDQHDRRETLRNDLKVREQAATFFDFAQSAATDIGGRYATETKQTVVGTTPFPYPPLPPSSPWAGPDLVGQEPPTGYRIDDLEHPTVLPLAVGAGPTSADAPAPSVERDDVGSLLAGDLAKPTLPLTSAGSPPYRSYRRIR
jgi:hypothetical protein